MKQNYLRRILSATILFLASTLTWAYDFIADDIYYNITGDATVEVTYGENTLDYRGNMVIPSTVTYNDKTYNVTGIGRMAFYYCSRLVSVDIPEGVTSIGYEAFRDSPSLTSVNIPNSVTSIEGWVFRGCSSLTSVNIPNGVTIIKEYTFYNCSALESIVIPDGVTTIEGLAFYGCSSLQSINIPDGVTSIGNRVFCGCSALESIDIPSSVTSIGYSAFYGCSSLTSIVIPDGVTNIVELTFYECSSLTSIDIPSSVTSIGYSAFQGCSALESIDIPSSVTSIEYSAFEECTSLTSIDIPSSVATIGNRLFYGCSSLTSINIPESVTSIGGNVFYQCTSLASIDIPSSVTSIGDRTFGFTPLTSINIPDGVKTIGNEVFFSCDSLTSIVIGKNLMSVGKSVFSFCPSLESITVSADNRDHDSRDGCNAIIDSYTNTLIAGCKNTIIPESVTSIGYGAFFGCPITSIDIPSSVTSIGLYAFSRTSLISVKIPSSVTSIGDSAFDECYSLTSIDIPTGVTEIKFETFEGCSSLTTVICRAENAPKCGTRAFRINSYNTPESRLTLYVPTSALENYKAADTWRSFGTILPIVELDYAQKEGWNTIVLPFSADLETFGEGAKAYAFTGATDGVLSFSTVDHLEAHTPYIIYAPEAQELSLNNFHDTTDPNATTAPSVEHNGVTFRGTYEDIDAPDMQGKYGVADDARIRRGSELAYIKAYHAYFEAAAGAEVKAISFDGDDATGIIEIADALQQDAQYYNLAGQRTQKPQKGVNIVNGKKVLY